MSKDKLRILIKILAESHMASYWEIKSTFDSTQTDRPALISTCLAGLTHAHEEVEIRAGLSVCVLSNVDFSD